MPVKRELTNCSPCFEKSVPYLYSTVLDYFRPLTRVLEAYHVQQRVSSRHLHGVQRQVLPRAHHNQSRALSIWQELSRQEMTQCYAVEFRRPLISEEILGPPLFLLRQFKHQQPLLRWKFCLYWLCRSNSATSDRALPLLSKLS